MPRVRRSLRLVVPSLLLAALAASKEAAAIEFKDLGGRPLSVDVTNTAILNYHFDNRNDFYDGVRKPDASVKVDDNYFEYINRLNVQVGYWRFRLNVRLDAQAYAGTIGPDNALDYVIEESEKYKEELDSTELIRRTNEYLSEVDSRFHPGIYPAKLSLTYQQPGLELTAGDFYAQLGRGMVLSVRKIDELAIDTTIRGGKVQASKSFGSYRIGGMLLGGQLNPQRGDEASGRLLTTRPSALFFGFPEPSYSQSYDKATGRLVTSTVAVPNYLPDTVFGGRIEGGHTLAQLAANASVLLRERSSGASSSPSLEYGQIRTFSGSLTLPQLSKYADLYVEVAGQQVTEGTAHADSDGYAVYANANFRAGPMTLTLEGKHYRRLLGLAANVGAEEFTQLAYNQPPTAEPIYVEPVGSPNVCNTGGRAEAKYRFNRETSVYGWLGYYASFSEFGENSTCEETPEHRTNTWDAAVGGDLGFETGKSYAKAWIGGRLTDFEVPTNDLVNVPDSTSVFYREGYVRYDLVKHLTGAFSLQSQGFHRHRYLPERFGNPWWEGENYLALQWAPRLAATFGYEYTNQPGCSRDANDGDFCHYVSGGLIWRGLASDGVWGQIFNSVTVFVGQRRAAIRCVSGVCRQFPPFEGAKLELVSRF
jgi:hypothetical protein